MRGGVVIPIGRKFGQHEPLTTRLHNLVRSYPKGFGILKEFIQNADDAGADEIVFVIDEQQYNTVELPESMHPLHTNPALLIYNNKPFDENDIQGIQRLGESDKSKSLGKTGRFGLGFNACYNVTDIPYLFTKGMLYFFDPHCQTLPGAPLESPGCCYSVDEVLGEGWPLLDVFQHFVTNWNRFNGTVFRLPFRTEQQATASKIKKDAYTVSDALHSVNELQEMGSAILLFLKHVRRLKVEHRRQDGSVADLLSIQATNIKDILRARTEINDLLSSSDPERLLTELSKRGQIYSSCLHEYSIIVDGVERREKWRVVDGFFADDAGNVLNVCRKMIESEEKALPYAGVAWPLNSDRQPVGRIFCFLPVPMQTSMPVQINGYFDLDDSRQSMFLDSSAQGSASYRVSWNKTLLENSVAQAYVRLLEDLRWDLGNNIESYYKAFPIPNNNEASWEGWLTSAFYKYASEAPLYRVSGEAPWSVLSATRSLPIELLSVGNALISENFLPIPNPQLPEYIETGFTTNGIGVPLLAPNDLRIQLKELKDVNCPIEAAPRACLQNREYIEKLFSFCLSDSPEEELWGLPLIIDCRGHIRTLGLTDSPLYLMEHQCDREIFWDHPEWFVDPELAKKLNLVETEYAGLLDMDSQRFVRTLCEYVAEQDQDEEIKMSNRTAGTLTDAWLQAVFRRLLESDLDNVDDNLKEIPLVPDQSRVLRHMGFKSTPLLFRGSERDLKNALIELSVPLVSGVSNNLFKLLVDFSENKGLIWKVTPHDLVDTLVDECSEVLQEYERVTKVHRVLLDYLSKDESLEELKKWSDRQKDLKALMLFPTSNGTLVNLNETAYVPENFKFPSVDFDVILLDTQSHQWRNLYILLGARQLSRSRLIRELLLPSFEQFDAPAQVQALTWLRDNLSFAQSEDDSKGSNELFAEVQNTPLVLCEDGQLRAPVSVYQPESKLAREVFGGQAAFPDMKTTYAEKCQRWLEFFRQLDMPTEPRLSDVVNYVRKIITENSDDHITDRLKAVYEFVKGRVEAELQEKKDVSEELSDLLGELADIPWIPVRQEAGDFLCFEKPEAGFARPGDVYFPRVGQLVASQAYITILGREPNELTRKAMGFPVKTPVALVIKHFQELISACSDEETMPNERALVRVLGQIYRFFGGEAPRGNNELDTDTEYQAVDSTGDLSKFSEIPCIWDQINKRFWRPDHVFMENVRYMEPWRRTILSNDHAIERGYEALGRRQSPTIDDWKKVLEEIAESGKSPEEAEVSEVIRQVVRHIVDELQNEEATDGEVLVPTPNGVMLPAETVFLADASWYQWLIESGDIPILSPSLSGIWGIQRTLRIASLANSVEQRLIEYPTESDLHEEREECSRLEVLLQSREFILGLQRLLRHEGLEVSEKSLDFLSKVNVRCVDTIHTCLYLQLDGTERFLGDAETDFYWDQDSLQVMLTEKRKRYFCNDLADLLKRALGDNFLNNLAPLVEVLKSKPYDIMGVLDDLKIRTYSYDLEEDLEDYEGVDPQDFPDDENDTYEQNECEKTEESKEYLANEDESMTEEDSRDDEDESMADDDSQDDEPDSATGYSEPERIRQTDRISTATKSRPSGNSQSADQTGGGGRSDDAFWSKTSKGIGSSEQGTGFSGQSDKSGHPTNGTGGSSSSSTSSKRKPTKQRRIVSYVLHGGHSVGEPDVLSEDNHRNLQIGEAAVKKVIDHEKRNGRQARSMAHNNAGYDVISEGNGQTRYIEVKGTEAAWGERGVSLTPTQFFYANENPDRDYWLYVVEDVFSETSQIHEIHNPSKMVDKFVFDGGWRQVAESADDQVGKTSLPLPGDEVLLNGNVVGIVESVTPAGKFSLVTYRDRDGNQQRKRLADIVIHPKEAS